MADDAGVQTWNVEVAGKTYPVQAKSQQEAAGLAFKQHFIANGTDPAIAERLSQLPKQRELAANWGSLDYIKQNALPGAGAIAGGMIPGPQAKIPGVQSVQSGLGAVLGDYATAGLRGQPMPSLGQEATRFGVTAGTDAAVRGVFNVLGRIGGRMIPQPAPNAPQVAAAAEATGVPLKPSDVTASPVVAGMENFLRGHPTARGPMGEAIERQSQAINTATQDFLNKTGRPPGASPVTTGSAVSANVAKNADTFKAVENQLWDKLAQTASDQNTRVDISGLQTQAKSLLESQMARLERQRNPRLIKQLEEILDYPATGVVGGAPATANTGAAGRLAQSLQQQNVSVGEISAQLKKMGFTAQEAQAAVSGLAGEGQAGVPWAKVREWQKAWGQTLNKQSGLLGDIPDGEATALWKAATSDLEKAAGATPQLSTAFQQARALASKGRELFKDSSLSQVLDKSPEQVAEMVTQGGPTLLRQTKDALLGDPALGFAHNPGAADLDTWNLVRRHIFEGLFAPPATTKGQTTPLVTTAQLTRRLANLGRESLDILLNPTEQTALGNLVTVSRAVRAGENLGQSGFSITGQQAGYGAMFSAPGAALGSLVGQGTAGGIVSYLFLPQVMAKAITNPAVAQYLASEQFQQTAQTLARTGVITREATAALAKTAALLATSAQPAGAEPGSPPAGQVRVGPEASSLARGGGQAPPQPAADNDPLGIR